MSKISPWLKARLAARATSRKAKRSKREKPAADTTKLQVVRLGKVMAIDYRHASDNRGYRHKFNGKTGVFYTKDRRYLVIGPIDIKAFIDD